MPEDHFDLVKFAAHVREVLNEELDLQLGNMEVVAFADRLYRLAEAQAYNKGVNRARSLIEGRLRDIDEQLQLELRDD